MLSKQHVTHETVDEVDRIIDAATGWTKEEILDSGERLVYDYDAMGRVKSIDRQHAADLAFVYTQNADDRWTVQSQAKPPAGGPAIRTYTAELDGLGRVTREEIPGFDGATVAP